MRYVFKLSGYTLEDVFKSDCILYDYHEFDSHYVDVEGRHIWFTSNVDSVDVDQLSINGVDEDSEDAYTFMETYVLHELGDNTFELILLGLDVLFEGDYDLTVKPNDYRGNFTYFENSYSNLRRLHDFVEICND